MKVDELANFGIPQGYIDKIKEEKVSELYPPQADMVRKNLLGDKNLLISIPTAGGKTLMAALAIIKKFSETKCKAVYIAPLVALANEKYEYFKWMFGDQYRVGISVGDLDSDDPWLANYDIIVCTTEKLDSLTRHEANWLDKIGLIIVDEIHLLNDRSRGPTLEVLLTKLRKISPRSNVLGLSATVKNSSELAKWLNANLVISDFRPVKLHEGVLVNNRIQFFSHDSYQLSELETEAAIMENTMQMKKQALFFLSTRKNAEALAERLAGFMTKMISSSEKEELTKLSDDVLNVLETPTKQCKRLALCMRNGTAFHHAGLLGKQKRMIEDAFRKGIVKVITSTPTLALGVNLPAFRVVIRDPKRFYAGAGLAYIPVMEYRQMIGRAGRPKYDEFGESILVARSEEEAAELVEKFVQGEVEEIRSKLAVEPILRTHALALIASNFTKSEESLLEFFSNTFYSFQYGDDSAIRDKIVEILGELVEWGFIDYTTDKIEATKIGKRISELYIDPQTAHNFLESLERAMSQEHDIFSLLHVVCRSKELEPKLNPRTSEVVDIGNLISQRDGLFLQDVPEEWDIEFDDFVRSVKTAMLFEEWMEEATDDQLLSKFNMAPGEMRNKIDIADWLIYSMHELSMLSGYKNLLNEIRKLRIRMSYGVKEELVPLVKLEQVGRVRARRLFKAGFKSLDDLRKAPVESLEKIVGKKVADQIKKQVGAARLITKKMKSLGEDQEEES